MWCVWSSGRRLLGGMGDSHFTWSETDFSLHKNILYFESIRRDHPYLVVVEILFDVGPCVWINASNSFVDHKDSEAGFAGIDSSAFDTIFTSNSDDIDISDTFLFQDLRKIMGYPTLSCGEVAEGICKCRIHLNTSIAALFDEDIDLIRIESFDELGSFCVLHTVHRP